MFFVDIIVFAKFVLYEMEFHYEKIKSKNLAIIKDNHIISVVYLLSYILQIIFSKCILVLDLGGFMNKTNIQITCNNRDENYITELDIGNITPTYIQTYINFPFPNKETHTMSYALDKFCNQKIPIEIIKNYINKNYTIDILGLYPDFFISFYYKVGYRNVVEIPFINNTRLKKNNFIRPRFFIATNLKKEKKIIICITPGDDYIKHYTSILIHSLDLLHFDSLKLINIFRFKDHENNLTTWSNLNYKFIKKNDIVIIGNINEIITEISKLDPDWNEISYVENKFYNSTRFILSNGKVVNFLGVTFSYWGNMSSYIVKKILQLGASEIIYSAKLGSLSNPKSLYNDIFCPNQYIIFDYIDEKSSLFSVDNKFLEKFPELKTGLHCSVPTILEQNYYLREKLTNLSVVSIDNEISKMAKTILDFNTTNNTNINFSCLHFATDYVRKFDEKLLRTDYDLSNNRSEPAKLKKAKIIEKISKYLYMYLEDI